VLRKSLEARLPVILVVNKIDRPDARTKEVVDEVYQLFLDLDADEHQIEFPILYADARAGRCGPNPASLPEDLEPLFDALRTHIPAPSYEEDHPLQALVTNLDASPYVGRLALCRVRHGTIRRGQEVAWCRADGTTLPAKISELYVSEALDRVEAEEAGPGEIVAVAGIEEVTIGETLADPDDPRPLPVTRVDEPSLSMTIGINTSPLSGRDGSKLTAPQVKARLDAEVIGNVSIRVLDGDRPDRWEVQGRGELQLAVLVEVMRREGFELTVGKPQVVTRQIDGRLHEPVERVAIDAPEEYLGVITQMLALRKGRMENMVNHGTGWIRMEHLVPARGLIGFRTEFLTETRGMGQLHHVFEGYEPWHGELRTRPTGSLVADRAGLTTAFALLTLQERGSMFVGPGEDVYEGMIVGENARSEDIDVNPTKEKKLTNMRESTSEQFTRLIPKRTLVLEQALEFIREDECVEVTPHNVRLRKVTLPQQERAKAARRGRPHTET
jgi:GTP-binding protein